MPAEGSAADADVTDHEDIGLPPDLAELRALSNEEMAGFEQVLREKAAQKNPDGIDRLVAEALWDERTCQERLTPVVCSLMQVFQDVVKSTNSDKLKDHLESGSRHVLNPLWRMATHPGMDRVNVRPGKSGAHCALVLGFAGSRLEDLKPQEDFYAGAGFSVITVVQCIFPKALRQRQLCRLARGLAHALANENAKLLVHMMSGHGHCFWNNVVGLWRQGDPPFDGLPDAKGRVGAYVAECFTPFYITEPIKDIEIPKDFGEWAEQLQEEAAEGGSLEFFGAANNCLESLVSAHVPDVRWLSLMSKHKEMSILLRSVSPVFDETRSGHYGAHMPFWRDSFQVSALEMEMLKSNGCVPPRLFLFSTQDKLFPAERVEAAIDQQWSIQPRGSKILVEKCTKSPHCKLWVQERTLCEKAVKGLMKVAKLKNT